MEIMKSILISIQPRWCELIASKIKRVEIRKTKPNIEVPFTCYIYQSKGKWLCKILYGMGLSALAMKLETSHGKVIGEFVCKEMEDYSKFEYEYDALLRHINLDAGTNGDYAFLHTYLGGVKKGYGWHISNLVIYEKPKDLSDFVFASVQKTNCFGKCTQRLTRPPQSWCYVEKTN